MTISQIVIVAIASGTCWVWILKMTIDQAATRIIKRMDELEETLKQSR
jgi:hypothetical protein